LSILTLAADDLNTHAGMAVPADRVKLDVSSDYWLVQVGVFHLVRVHISVKHLSNYNNAHRYDMKLKISIIQQKTTKTSGKKSRQNLDSYYTVLLDIKRQHS